MRSGLIALLLTLTMLTATLTVMPLSGVLAEDARLKVDLNDTDASFIGLANLEYAGFDSAFVGDVNGDQYDDLLVGAPGNEEMGQQAGKVYLIFGSDSDWGMDTPLSNANASFLAENVGESAGMSVAGGCDLNSDGYDDMVISAPQNSDVAQFAGKVYIILGKASGWTKDADIASEAVATFLGEAEMDQAGTALACAEDLNKDGFDDVLVGAPLNDEGSAFQGQVYVIFGRSSGWAKDVSLSDVDASFNGEAPNDSAGVSVAGLGDVNGDGYGDILIGAHTNTEAGGQHGNAQNQAGQVYLVFGKGSGWAMDASLADADASFWGRIDDRLGNILDGAGDINNDGYNDMLMGLPWSSDDIDQQGKAYLILGKESGWTMDTKLDVNCDASFLGASTREYAGYQVSGAGDFNDDGIDDLYIGGGGQANGNLDTSAYILFGKEEGWSRDMTLANADLVFTGSTSNSAIDGGADFNGDGIDDVLYSDAYNDEVGGNAGQVHLTYGFQLTGPATIDSVKIYSDDLYENETIWADVEDKVYYEVKASGGDPLKVDSLVVNISSDGTDPYGFRVRLYETGVDTGTYRGYLWVRDSTNPGNRWIDAAPGEHVTVSAVKDPTKSDTVLVGHLTITPWLYHETTIEDMEYLVHFTTENGTIVDMTLETDADWLLFNTTSNNLHGVPDNADVGTHGVTIKADDGLGNKDEMTFDIKVININPDILTDPVFDATEDVPYSVDFNSSDDGQGVITWYMATNASWLEAFDTGTGVLSGLPLNEHAGSYWVNVTVEDGNGGMDSANFTLTVHDVNEPPEITTEDVTVAYEDQFYAVTYKAKDNDLRDNRFTWNFDTDAAWLSIDNRGILYGTPENKDVGTYNVNVSVKDRALAEDWSEFTLVVMNTPPVILTTDVLTATEEKPYLVHYTSDDDGQGEIKWSMATNATWLKMDLATNNLTGTPTNDDVGSCWVEVSVEDGNGGKNSTNFTLKVINVNDPPMITSTPPLNATVGSLYTYNVSATDIDKGDVLNFSLKKVISGMTIDNASGLINWTPSVGLEGVHEVTVEVFDGTIIVQQVFLINVGPDLGVNITNLKEGQKISGKYTVSGTAKGPVDLKVEVDIDGKGWEEAEGSNTWTFGLDAKDLKEGKHTLKVRASWKGNVSEEISVTFKVEEEKGISASLGMIIGLIIGLILVLVIIAIVALMMMRRRKG